MKFKRTDFLIEQLNNNYKILVKKYVLWVIPTWNELTYKENNREDFFKFNTKKEAELFIEQICD
jgi:hypothetical protein